MQTQLWLVWFISPIFSSFYEDCQFKIKAYEILIDDLKNNVEISNIKSKSFNIDDKGGSTVEDALKKHTGILRFWGREEKTEVILTASTQLLAEAEKKENAQFKK